VFIIGLHIMNNIISYYYKLGSSRVMANDQSLYFKTFKTQYTKYYSLARDLLIDVSQRPIDNAIIL